MADVIAVSALNTYVRSLLEGDAALADIAVSGEISNFNRNFKTGHCYFTLKDSRSALKAVMFRSSADALAFRPQDGIEVVARGRVSLYERDGAFQLYVEFMFQQGQGAALLAFEALKQRLDKEGLFDIEHKQLLPAWPRKIALITSKTGAALQDILYVAQRRCPVVHIMLLPVTVQGTKGAGEVVAALRWISEDGSADLAIVARGGGSAEDLAVFNDEAVARAAYHCRVPLISAVGHETDVTLLDYVADQRAPTPSAAAELALPDLAKTYAGMMNVYRNIVNNMQFRLDSWYNELESRTHHQALGGAAAATSRHRARLLQLEQGVAGAIRSRQQGAATRLGHAVAMADGLNPYAVLARGYAIVRSGAGELRSVKQTKTGQALEVQMQDGSLDCRVEGVREGAADEE